MNIYIYSDESGVFDKQHNQIFVFGGIIFCSKEDNDLWSRKYLSAEANIRKSEKKSGSAELKAAKISNKSKNKLYRSLSDVEKFGIVINQKALNPGVFSSKKGKQRYLDWAFKMSVKTKFQKMIHEGLINPAEVENLTFYVDEHTTATNGKYELREALEQEFKHGTMNYEYNTFYPPIFPNLEVVTVHFCNSAKKTLVRAADIVANHIFYLAVSGQTIASDEGKLHIMFHPKCVNPIPNAETLAAMKEAEDMLNGKISAKKYFDTAELFSELDS